MKTAYDILLESHERLSAANPKDWKSFDEIMEDGTGAAVLQAMKAYAYQVAEDVLKRAADSADTIVIPYFKASNDQQLIGISIYQSDGDTPTDVVCVDKQSILNTQIFTP